MEYSRKITKVVLCLALLLAATGQAAEHSHGDDSVVATFSVVGYDPATGELGVAVQSRFFTVGNVVPWAKAGVGAIATQAYANTSFGWRGLDLLERGLTPEEVRTVLVRNDDDPARRQFGIVDATGKSVTYTGDGCSSWAGGRSGPNYAVQGNILTGEPVVAEMERAFLETKGTLADRLYASLLAGEAAGGDSRGKQSAALLVVKDGAGYGGYTDRAIDIRVDDSPEPFKELGRILKIAQMNYAWNQAWTLFTKEKYAEALPHMERAAKLAPEKGEVWYDVGIIRLANKDVDGALEAVRKSLELNPKLADSMAEDDDYSSLKENATFQSLITDARAREK